MAFRCFSSAVVLLAACPAFVAGQGPKAFTDADRIVSFHETRSKSRPGDGDAMRSLARALVARAEATGEPGDYDRAWVVLEQVEVLEPGEPPTLRDRAKLLLSRHRFPQALALAKSGLERRPDDVDLLEVAGDAALETGDLEAAKGFYDRLLQRSEQLTTYARLAHWAEVQGQYDEAASLLEKALATGQRKGAPTESVGWCRAVLGEVHLLRGKRDEARRQYEMGLKAHPDHLLVLEHAAELEKLEGHPEKAEANYRTILAKQANPQIQLALAALLAERGEAAKAAELRGKTMSLYERLVAGGNEGYLRPLAKLYLEDKRYADAARLAAHDMALRPTPESRTLLSEVLTAAAAAGKPVNGLGLGAR